MRWLLVAAGIHTLAENGPAPRALLIDGERILWAGPDPREAPPAERVVDVGSSWVTPSFVDAHVHATATGMGLNGVDLRVARSVAECVQRLGDHAARQTSGVLIGHGWDSFGWPERRPLHASDVARAAPGRRVLLSRIDGHSSVVDGLTLAELPLSRLEGVDRDDDGGATGWLVEEASEAARRHIVDALPGHQLATARQAACEHAAALGIGSIHEMGHPGLSSLEDACAWRTGDWPLDVQVWWAELDVQKALGHDLRPGGDLFLDGSIGSCTAAVSVGYHDGTTGRLFHADDAVEAFFMEATRAGAGAGVHAIGDRAVEQAVRALEAAAAACGLDAVRRCRHRLEHVELASAEQVQRMAELGAVASVQPAFDATWGGPEGLYAERFGASCATASNPLSWFADAGVPLAFGSDSTVTPMDPWGGVLAAEQHRGGLALGRSAALAAYTLGGRFVAGQDGIGPLAPGMRADLAVWSADPLAQDDPRTTVCVSTLVGGRPAHGQLKESFADPAPETPS